MFDATHKAVGYLMQNFHEAVTLDSLAAEIGLGKYQLSRLFARDLGISFPRYLRQLRVEKAKELLLSEDESISNIALACGFDTLRSLELAFKEMLDVTPRDFRKKPNFKNADSL